MKNGKELGLGIELGLFIYEESQTEREAFPLEALVLEFAYVCRGDNVGVAGYDVFCWEELYGFARHKHNLKNQGLHLQRKKLLQHQQRIHAHIQILRLECQPRTRFQTTMGCRGM